MYDRKHHMHDDELAEHRVHNLEHRVQDVSLFGHVLVVKRREKINFCKVSEFHTRK